MTQERLALEEETIRICQELIRIPSVNYGEGRGDEKAVAAYVVDSLAEVGITATSYESAPNRVNVVAKIKGSDSSRPGLVGMDISMWFRPKLKIGQLIHLAARLKMVLSGDVAQSI